MADSKMILLIQSHSKESTQAGVNIVQSCVPTCGETWTSDYEAGIYIGPSTDPFVAKKLQASSHELIKDQIESLVGCRLSKLGVEIVSPEEDHWEGKPLPWLPLPWGLEGEEEDMFAFSPRDFWQASACVAFQDCALDWAESLVNSCPRIEIVCDEPVEYWNAEEEREMSAMEIALAIRLALFQAIRQRVVPWDMSRQLFKLFIDWEYMSYLISGTLS